MIIVAPLTMPSCPLPLWSTASVGSVPLLEWRGPDGSHALDEEAQARIARDVVDSAYRVIEGKGATNYAIGLASTRIVEAVVNDERRILPVSLLLDDYYGIGDVCLSVPAVVHAGGVGERFRHRARDARDLLAVDERRDARPDQAEEAGATQSSRADVLARRLRWLTNAPASTIGSASISAAKTSP